MSTKNKRKISTTLAIILTIFFIIGGIVIVWLVVEPMLINVEDLKNFGTILEIKGGGYTIYDSYENFSFVQIYRGNDNYDMIGLNIIFDINGNLVKYRVDAVPEKNGLMTYSFDFFKDGVFGVPSSVKVAPIYLDGNLEKIGNVISEVKIPQAKIYLDDWEAARNESRKNYLDLY